MTLKEAYIRIWANTSNLTPNETRIAMALKLMKADAMQRDVALREEEAKLKVGSSDFVQTEICLNCGNEIYYSKDRNEWLHKGKYKPPKLNVTCDGSTNMRSDNLAIPKPKGK